MDIKRIWLVFLMLISAWTLSAQTYSIGDVYTAPDGSQGIVYYLYPDGSGGWAVALTDASSGCEWGDGSDVPTMANVSDSYSVLYGSDTAAYTNTRNLRNYQNNSSYAAGVVDFAHGWTLPTLRQLRTLYSRMAFIATPLLNAGGVALSNTVYYWCCMENSSRSAWGVDFSSGGMSSVTKSRLCRVRAVRSFSYRQEDPSSECTFLWSTGSAQADITVNPTQTTDYSVTVGNANGCTGTGNHTVTVLLPDTVNMDGVVCEHYDWNGTTYTESGDYTQTFTNQFGCDSIVTLHLTVNHGTHHVTDTVVCESYIWTDGTGSTYTVSGTYTFDYTNAEGCESADTLHLTIKDSINVTITATADTICMGESVTLQAEADAPTAPTACVPTIAIGDILCTDNSIVKPSAWPVEGKTAMGIVFYVDNTDEHGWVLHLHDQSSTTAWSSSLNGNIPGITNFNTAVSATADYNGMLNTSLIRSAGNASLYPAAWLVDVANGWYLPASGQLYMLYAVLPILNASLEVCGGTPIDLDGDWLYWSSSVAQPRNVWSLDMYGNIAHYIPTMPYNVRSVHDF